MAKQQDEILEKARKIIAEREISSNRIEVCLTADICPNCGAPAQAKRRMKKDGNTYEIYNFRCNQCTALYQKLSSRGGEWTEILPF